MSDVKDTVATTETDPSVDNGTAAEQVNSSEESTKEQEIDRAAYEAALEKAKKADDLEKELQKRDMELNQRRNNEKKAELERLAAEGKDKERADALQAELDEIRAKEAETSQRQEAENFRKEILGRYPKEVQEAAEDISLWWDNPQNFEEAEAQLTAKADKLAARLGAKTPEPQAVEADPKVYANNPQGDSEPTEIDRLRSMSSKDMRKILPVAPPR